MLMAIENSKYNIGIVLNRHCQIMSYMPISDKHFVGLLSVKMSHVLRKPAFCICDNKDADQLCGNRTAYQRLCFRYTDITIPLLPKYGISSL